MILDLDTIKQRLRDSLLPPDSSKTVPAAAAHLTGTLGENGAWADLTAPENTSAPDGGPEHLERVLTLVRARFRSPDLPPEPAFRALDFWLAHDFQSADWRQNQIEVPRLLGGIALLTNSGLSPGAWGKVSEILARSRWARWVPGAGWMDWTGVTRLRMAHNLVLRGCLEHSPALVSAAFEHVFREIRVVAPDEEGIQADLSFHSPEASAAGGLTFAMECARFITLAHGTPWQAPPECMKQFVAYLLDGQQWVIRQGVIDYGAPDGGVAQGPRNLDGLAVIVEQLTQLANPPRRIELAALARRLTGRGDPLVGHRRFWRSDLVVHQRPAFYASLRLGSTRDARGELRPTSGPEAPFTGGLTYVLRSGREYQHLSRLWDRRMLPGTTTLQPGPALPAAETPPDPVDGNAFVGSVGEGDYGVAAMELARDGLQGRKAWFFFDQSFVCLGTRLHGAPPGRAVCTSVNQCELHGPVIAVTDRLPARPLAPGQEHDLSAVRRVEHDGISYHFAEPARVTARLGTPGDAGTAPAVFSLWIDHGPQPQSASYAYIVQPVGTDSGAAVRAKDEIGQIEILANTPTLQTVRHRGLRLLGVAFWEAGLLALPGGGRVAANRPCLLLCRESATAGTRLSMANPLREAATVHIEYAGRCLCFELPGGSDAGRSVSRLL